MKVSNRVKNLLISGLCDDKVQITKDFEDCIDLIDDASTVEEIMEAKKGLLRKIIHDIPLCPETCYFCIMTEMHCDDCAYGEEHGICCEDHDSVYNKIDRALYEVLDAIDRYYTGEEYGD